MSVENRLKNRIDLEKKTRGLLIKEMNLLLEEGHTVDAKDVMRCINNCSMIINVLESILSGS